MLHYLSLFYTVTLFFKKSDIIHNRGRTAVFALKQGIYKKESNLKVLRTFSSSVCLFSKQLQTVLVIFSVL